MPSTPVWVSSKEDGWYSWLVCLVGFTVEFIVMGFYVSYGIIFVSLVDENGVDETTAAWIGSISYAICYATSPIVNRLSSSLGYRFVGCLGGLLFGSGLFLTSYVRSFTSMIITYGVVFGVGCSFSHFTAVLVQPKFFKRKRLLAVGVALGGAGMGALVIGYLMEISLQQVGLRLTFQLFSLLGIPLFIGPLLYSPNPTMPSKIYCEKDTASQDKQSKSTRLQTKATFDMAIWKNKALLLHTGSMWIYAFAYYTPSVHLVNMAKTVGVSTARASLLPSAIAISQSVGRIFFGQLFVVAKLNVMTTHQSFLLLAAVATTLCPLANGFASLLLYAAVFGFSDSCSSVLTVSVIEEIAGEEGIDSGYVLQMLGMSFFLLIGPPLTGLLYSVSGSYDVPFYLCGAFVMASTCITFLVPMCPRMDKSTQHLLPITLSQATSKDSFKCKSLNSSSNNNNNSRSVLMNATSLDDSGIVAYYSDDSQKQFVTDSYTGDDGSISPPVSCAHAQFSLEDTGQPLLVVVDRETVV